MELDIYPTFFNTKLGLRRVPRQKTALRPDASMINNARRGVMSKFLRSGIIIRASELDPMVDPETAIISLTDSVEMETDHLLDDEEQIPESEKTLKNLFYISVKPDELPSYHFWRGKDDPDPINVHGPIDWDEVFRNDATTRGKKPHKVKPARGNEKDDTQHNQVLKTTLPTGASKITQQSFNRPTSPLNLQEPLVQGENPKERDLQGNEAHEFDKPLSKEQHEKGELEFLDFYDEKSNGEFISGSEYYMQRTSSIL